MNSLSFSEQRITTIKQRLTEHLTPSQLEVIDDSAQHHGHSGSQNGAGHFTVIINSPKFIDHSLVECHQLVYAALGNMIGPEIHALQIKILR